MRKLHLFAVVLALSGCAITPPSVQTQVREVCGLPAPDLSNVDAYATCVNLMLDQLDMQQREEGFRNIQSQ